ncbi:hypothetical protein FBU30_000393 [Linnemannia zychae]|nr:hypothetical protein FBU30_000393 [Linnemannia zychae]
MFEEMRKTLNGVGDYPNSDDENCSDSDIETYDGNINKTIINAHSYHISGPSSTSHHHSVGNDSTVTHKDNNTSTINNSDNTIDNEEDAEDTRISLSYTHPPPGGTENATANAPEKKKKKKKKKKAKIDLEDYLTAEDPNDQQPEDPYDKYSPAERVEIAVTRFRKNRKFSPERSQILSVYLDYGGIQSGPKMFQGGGVNTGGPDDNGEVDFDAMNAGIDRVDLPEDGQVVDFTNVVTTFLSQYFLQSTGWIDMLYYKDTPIVVAALLNYLLIRNVLPEYKEDLEAALAIAEKAKIELPLCKLISNGWPSRYDKACSLLYGGEWYDYLDDPWQGHEAAVQTLGLDESMAKKIVKSIVGPDVDIATLTVKPREFLELEIISIPDIVLGEEETDLALDEEEIDDATTVDMVDRMLLGKGDNGMAAATMESTVTDKVKEEIADALMVKYVDVTLAVVDPDFDMESQKPMSQRRKVHIYFDPNIANKLLVGMRIRGYVYTLSNGMSYLEQAAILPTYYLEADEIVQPEDEWED